MAYTGKKPIDHTDVTQSQSMTVTDDLTVEGGTVDINGNELILDADGDTSITSDTDDQIDFRTAGADRWQILSNGNLKAATNGLGIDFSASEGSGASSSVLDDYEEGNWTPTFGRTGTAFTTTPTYTNQQGRYIKVGKLVHATCNLRFSNNFSGGSGNYKVDGLPFTAGSQLQGIAQGITSVFVGDLNHNQGNYVSGTTVIYSSNNVLNSAPVSDYLTFTVTYEVA